MVVLMGMPSAALGCHKWLHGPQWGPSLGVPLCRWLRMGDPICSSVARCAPRHPYAIGTPWGQGISQPWGTVPRQAWGPTLGSTPSHPAGAREGTEKVGGEGKTEK